MDMVEKSIWISLETDKKLRALAKARVLPINDWIVEAIEKQIASESNKDDDLS